MNQKPCKPSMGRLNSLMEGSGYSILENESQYILCDPNTKEIVRSKNLRNLDLFVESILAERNQMIAAGKDMDIRCIIKPTRQVTLTSPDDSTKKTYHIIEIVEWNRVVVKYFNVNAFVYEVIPMKCFVEWYIMGRLG